MTFKKFKDKIISDIRSNKIIFESDGRNYYVYRISNIKSNKHYYGSRVTKLNPKMDIGFNYFSSSYDKEFLKEQKSSPENFKYKIIRIFDNPADSIIYESFLHNKFNVGSNARFINRTLASPFGFDPTGNIQSVEKRKETMSRIDPCTGLSGYQKSGIKSKISNSKIDPETGLSGYQKSGIKSKISNSKIDPCTGLSGYQRSMIKIKESNSKIDTETGLTGYKINGINASKTMSRIDPVTHKSIYDTSSIKTKNTRSKIDDHSGLNSYQSAIIKSQSTMNKVDIKTGLTGYQTAGKTLSKTLNTIQESGLTKAEEIGIKTSKTLNTIQESGLTRSKEIGLKTQGESHYSFNGYYMFNNVRYIDPRMIECQVNISVKTIRSWCRNSSKIISKRTYSQSKFLQDIGEIVIGKSFDDIGFNFYIVE